MKLFLNSLFVSLLFICTTIKSEDVFKKYIVKVSGVKIGTLNWEVSINNKAYKNKIYLKSKGFLSTFYKFEGNYYSKGFVENSILKPEKYTHIWKTNKIKKNMSLVFENQKLKSLEQFPIEKEYLRVYPYNEELSHIIGYLGTEKDGLSGVEKKYNEA